MLLRTMHSKRRRGTEGSSVSRKGKIYIVSIVMIMATPAKLFMMSRNLI